MEVETVKNLGDLGEVRFCLRAGNENNIYIHKTMRNIENLVHHPLKSTIGIPQSKCHPEPLEEAKLSYHRRLWNVFFGHNHLIVTLG